MSSPNAVTETLEQEKPGEAENACCAPTCCGSASEAAPAPEELVGRVRERYSAIAEGQQPGCTSSGCGCGSEALGYDPVELAALPEGADLTLGCGAPLALLELRAGETVLDLGSGGGLDAFLAARRVGPSGRVIGVDMTPAMLTRARAAAEQGGFSQVEFREGRLEALPVEAASVDAVTSNCVINLVPDKAAVFAEVARVLKPGGRMVISDIVLAQPLPDVVARDLLAYVGCVAGAELREDYFAKVAAAGLERIEMLRDVDALELFRDAVPKEALELASRLNVRPEDLAGRVRSVTWRAWKPA